MSTSENSTESIKERTLNIAIKLNYMLFLANPLVQSTTTIVHNTSLQLYVKINLWVH